MNLLAQTIAALSCAVILWRAEPVLNRMTRSTPWLVRAAFWLIVVAAAGAIICIVAGDVPPWPSVIGSAGTAALLFCERRLRFLTRQQKEVRNDHARAA